MTRARPLSALGATAAVVVGLVAGAVPPAAAGTAPLPTRPAHTVQTTLVAPAIAGFAGSMVAADADTAVIGSWGSFSLYSLTGGVSASRSPERTFTAPKDAGQGFVSAAAIDGNLLAVTATSASDGGAVYVYQRPAGGWQDMTAPVAELHSPNPTTNGQFGASVAIQGGTIVVGAPGELSQAGRVYVFTQPATGWSGSAPGYATLSSPEIESEFGDSVAIDGDVIAVGAPSYNTIQTHSGAVAIFVEPGAGRWQDAAPTTMLLDGTPAAGRYLGQSVALYGRYVVAGSDSESGQVDVFAQPTGGWAGSGLVVDTARLTDSALGSTGYFGMSVSIDANEIVAGVPRQGAVKATSPSNTGLVDVYTEPRTGWAPSATPSMRFSRQTGLDNDRFGSSVLLDGSKLLVGADYVDQGRGATYVYTTLPSPTLTSVTQAHTSWKRGKTLPSMNPAKPVAGGTSFRFAANQAMWVTLAFARRTAPNRYTVVTSVHVPARAGMNTLYFGGRVSTHWAFPTGLYRVTLQGEDAADDRSAAHSLWFTLSS